MTFRHVQEVHARGVGHLRGKFARQLVAQIVLGQKDAAASLIDFRLVLADPEYLPRRETRERRVGGDVNEPLRADLFGYFPALRACPAIAPKDCGTENFTRGVQHDEAMHLSRKADTLYLSRVHSALGYDGTYRLAGRTPPVSGVLLGPSISGLAERILDRARGNAPAALVEERRFCTGCAEVYAYEVCHVSTPLPVQRNRMLLIIVSKYSCRPLGTSMLPSPSAYSESDSSVARPSTMSMPTPLW